MQRTRAWQRVTENNILHGGMCAATTHCHLHIVTWVNGDIGAYTFAAVGNSDWHVAANGTTLPTNEPGSTALETACGGGVRNSMW